MNALVLAGILLQATPPPQDGTPFESGGRIASTLGPAAPGYRPPQSDPERVFVTEEPQSKRRWLKIPVEYDAELQEGTWAWLKGIDKGGVFHVTEALVLPGDAFLKIPAEAKTSKARIQFRFVGGGWNRMPPIESAPAFAAVLAAESLASEPIEVKIERVFVSPRRDLLGKVDTKLQAMFIKDRTPFPLPFALEPGARQVFSLTYPDPRNDGPEHLRLHVTVLLIIGGERVLVGLTGDIHVYW